MTLIERLKAAQGGDRELDAAIFVHLRLEPAYSNISPIAGYVQNHPSSHMTTPEYTASVDAALSLVERLLPGRSMAMGHGYSPMPHCVLEATWFAQAPTLPLAILIALLSALDGGAK